MSGKELISLEKTEVYLLVLFMGLASYFIYMSRDMVWEASLFPQVTAGFVLIGCILIIVGEYLPKSLRSIVKDQGDLFVRTEFAESDLPKNEINNKNNSKRIDDSVITSLLLSIYIILGFMIGLLWATPIFVIAYSLIYKLPKFVAIILTLSSALISLGFLYLLNLPLMEGVVIKMMSFK